jgi:hypothetical protein
MDFIEIVLVLRTGFIWLRTDSFEHGNEPSGSMKCVGKTIKRSYSYFIFSTKHFSEPFILLRYKTVQPVKSELTFRGTCCLHIQG